jgi:hypothetical protein
LPDFGVDSPVPRPCSGGAANGIVLCRPGQISSSST